MVALAITGLSLAVGAFGTFQQISAQKKAAREQKKANDAQRRIQQEQTRRSRLQAVRQAQIARAQSLASGQAAGAVDSSAIAGGGAAIAAQTGAAVGSASQLSGLSNQITVFNQNAADAAQRAKTLGGIANLGFSAASFSFSNSDAINRRFASFGSTPAPNVAPVPSVTTSDGGNFGVFGNRPI